MKLVIEIAMDNAAFEERGTGHEAARILEAAALLMEMVNNAPSPVGSWPLRDWNGNRVGHLTVSDE